LGYCYRIMIRVRFSFGDRVGIKVPGVERVELLRRLPDAYAQP